MNIKYITYLFSSLFFSFLLMSCNDSTDNTTAYGSASKDAQIYSFALSAPTPESSDSLERIKLKAIYAIVNNTKFAIDQVGEVVYNPDSLPFGTDLNKVLLTPTFNSTYGISKVTIFTPDSINGYDWNLTDSVFVKKTPLSIRVTSQAGPPKTYALDIRIHKIDPDTILWNKMAAYPSAIGESKTILANDNNQSAFFTYTIVGGAVKLYTSSTSTINWTLRSLSGLPATLKTKSITVFNDNFYAIDKDGKSYKSADGIAWSKQNPTEVLESVVGVVPEGERSNDLLLVTYKDGGKYYFGKTKDLITISPVTYLSISPSDNEVPATFPLNESNAYTNYSTSKNSRMLLVAAGIDKTGTKELTDTWLIKNLSEGLELSPSKQDTILFKGKGVSLFAYNNNTYTLKQNQFYISSAWGQKWTIAPSKQMLSKEIVKRKDQSVIVDDKNYIWIFGGVSESGAYLNDVWRGRLNSLIPRK